MTKEKGQASMAPAAAKKTPLDSLVNELQQKINKQRLLITKLKQQAMGADAAELNEKLRQKDEKLDNVKKEIAALNEKLAEARKMAQSSGAASVNKALTEELQTKLNKAKRQIDALKSR